MTIPLVRRVRNTLGHVGVGGAVHRAVEREIGQISRHLLAMARMGSRDATTPWDRVTDL